MHQPDHPERDGHRDAGAHQGPVPGRQLDVFGAEEIDPGVALMRAAGQREPGIEANDVDLGSQTGRHGATDYP
ncbi:Uncharacterised protein [Mycobacterium tuberculosis]|nr:Uncharacterised protein [Mycobacterium tuberculosis]